MKLKKDLKVQNAKIIFVPWQRLLVFGEDGSTKNVFLKNREI